MTAQQMSVVHEQSLDGELIISTLKNQGLVFLAASESSESCSADSTDWGAHQPTGEPTGELGRLGSSSYLLQHQLAVAPGV